MKIAEGGLDDPRVAELLRLHVTRARAETAPGSAHALDLSGLTAPDIRFWTAWMDDEATGCVAMKNLGGGHGEIKSMYTAEAARGRGVASALLLRLMEDARRAGITRLSLETGSWPYFRPAVAFYRRHGFAECGPFEGYREDPNSIFMTLALQRNEVQWDSQ